MASSSSLSSSSSVSYFSPTSAAPLTSAPLSVISAKSIETLNSSEWLPLIRKFKGSRILNANTWQTKIGVRVSAETPIPAAFKDYIAKRSEPFDLMFMPAMVDEKPTTPELLRSLAFARDPAGRSVEDDGVYMDPEISKATDAYYLEYSKDGLQSFPKSLKIKASYWVAIDRKLRFKGEDPTEQRLRCDQQFESNCTNRRASVNEVCTAILFAQVLREAPFGEFDSFVRVNECIGSTFLRSCIGSNKKGLLQAHCYGVSFEKVGCALVFDPSGQDDRVEKTKERLPEESKSSS